MLHTFPKNYQMGYTLYTNRRILKETPEAPCGADNAISRHTKPNVTAVQGSFILAGDLAPQVVSLLESGKLCN